MAGTRRQSAPESILAKVMCAVVLASQGWLAGCGGSDGGAPYDDGGMRPGGSNPPAESTLAERQNLVIFDDTRIHDVKLFMSSEDWKSILEDSRGDEPRPATLSLDGVVIADVSVRPSGESSRVPGNTKMSMRVNFDTYDKTKNLGGFDSIKLSGAWDDPFLIRDQMAYWFFRQFMPAPREVSTRLTANGESRGAYQIEEIWSKTGLERHFTDASGPLYRMRGVSGQDPYEYRGPDPMLYVPVPWDAKGKHLPEAHAAIGRALRVLGEDPARLNDVIDVDNMLTYFAVNAVLANTDGFTSGFEIDDVYEYHDPTSGRFFMLPWDPDNTFGSINDSPTRDIFENYDKSILTRLVRDKLRGDYFAKIDEVMRRVPATMVQAEVERMAGQIRELVSQDNLKMYPTASFEWSLGYVKKFIAARYASVSDQIRPVGP